MGIELAWRKNPPEFLRRAAQEYGPLCAFQLRKKTVYLLNEPDWVREVLVAQEKAFHKGPGFQKLRPWLGNGVVTSEGEQHRRHRRLLQPAFHRKRIEAYAETMTAFAQQAAESLSEGVEIDLMTLIERTSHTISTRCMFDTNLDAGRDNFFKWMGQGLHYLDIMSSYSPMAMVQRISGHAEKVKQESVSNLQRVVDEIITSRRRDTQDRGDLLSMLVSALDEAGDGQGLTDNEVRDEVITILLGSFDTVTSSLTTCFSLLARHPEAEAALSTEVKTVLQGRLPTLADVPRLALCNAAFSEALRLQPPAWLLPRAAQVDVTIGGHLIPAGSVVLVSSYVSHRDPRWFPEPDRFDLNRWTPENRAALPKFTYFPFGSGPRVCIGEQFALMQATILLSTLLARWHFEPVSKAPLKYKATVALRPKDGLKVRVSRR